MKRITRKIPLYLLTGFVLLTGCNKSTEKDSFSSTTNIEFDENDENNHLINQTISNNKPELNNSNESKVSKMVEQSNEVTEANNLTADEKIITYINNFESDLENLLNKQELNTYKNKVITKFITITDFIFYDKEIEGIKFTDLKTQTKLMVVEQYQTVDQKLEKLFPNYKENIADKYDIAKAKIKEKYNEIKPVVKEDVQEKIGSDNYQNLEEAITDIKDAAEVTKDVTGYIGNEVKTKVKDWYQNLKNNY